jgi:hypothetical protein
VNNANPSSAFSSFATGTFASNTLTLTYPGGGRDIAFIPLTAAQTTSVKNAIEITIVITVAGTAPSGTFRYGLADKTLGGGWNGTSVSAGFSALTVGANTLRPAFDNASNGRPSSSFFIQRENSTGPDTVDITKIEITLVLE